MPLCSLDFLDGFAYFSYDVTIQGLALNSYKNMRNRHHRYTVGEKNDRD